MRLARLVYGNRWLTALCGLLIGCLVGLAVFAAGQLTGWRLAALIGGVVGLVLAPILRAYSGADVEVRDVKLKLQLLEASFVPRQDTQAQAYRLYVELGTRVATVPLQAGAGSVKAALDSLYALFTNAREVIPAAPVVKRMTGPTVLDLALRMLNTELRPFLTGWHARFDAWRSAHPDKPEDDWPENARFRDELAALQPTMREYMLGFAKLAGLSDEQIRLTWPPTVEMPRSGQARVE